jgi:6-phosphofructokinase 1
MQKIAVLTSGGDAPGMNALIRAVVRRGAYVGLTVYGVRHGYDGLMSGDIEPLGPRDVGNIIQRGGTILGSSRSTEFRMPVGRERAAATLREAGIDGLVICGGDGTFRGGIALAEHWSGGIVGVPATIDNDVFGTDTTIGFDTAVNTALEAIDRIRDTAEAQERVFLVEVMGRHCGAIALHVGLAGGAVAALAPEAPHDFDALIEFLQGAGASGRTSSIIVVAEGDETGGAFEVARKLEPYVSAPMRVTVLGHIQRGGSPTAASRILGTRFGVAAVDALMEGISGVLIGLRGNDLVHVPLSEAVARQRPADPSLIALILSLAG